MTFGELLQEYDEPGKKIARHFESTQKKITNAQLAVVFNKECIKNNLLPNFIYIHTYTHTHIQWWQKKIFTLPKISDQSHFFLNNF